MIAERPELKKPRTPVTIVKETANSALLDGGNNLGYVALLRAVEVATEKVRSAGIAIIGLRNTWFSGGNAYYMEKRPRGCRHLHRQQHADGRAPWRRAQDAGHESDDRAREDPPSFSTRRQRSCRVRS